jgi:anti-anti-sigma factor
VDGMELAPRRFAETLVLSPKGRIDHATAEPFRSALWREMEASGADLLRIVLDVSDLDYISSAGLRVLMLAAKRARSGGGILVVAAPRPMVREILEISKFTLVFPVFATVREAVSTASPEALAAFDAL